MKLYMVTVLELETLNIDAFDQYGYEAHLFEDKETAIKTMAEGSYLYSIETSKEGVKKLALVKEPAP